MTQIKGILFDKDGTLVDFQATWHAIGDAMALEAAQGDRMRADVLMDAAGYDATGERFRADSVFAAGTNADIVALWHPGLTDGQRLAMIERFDSFCAIEGAAKAVALPGVLQAIRDLHASGIKLGVATNDSTAGAERTLLALGIAQMFDAAFGYDAVAKPKPAPDSVIAFCDLTGLKPSEIAMVGDNRHDLELGRAGGVGLNVGVLSGTGTQESLSPLADIVIGSVAELPTLLAAQG
ncbi:MULTISPECIES: HAD family hydrolase [Mesorhizobium]|uniref:phosphoglycolate phosphatase n=1 Tax=Mesorhizobium denitrificans TaxID=2294114 RepID=A0A371XD31_9HYPH|nr:MULTISPECIES: HAD family hydrolase [Mesorhizobium]RFC67149.1 HAD family hydrolase [Mesorhizobium denitrificans]